MSRAITQIVLLIKHLKPLRERNSPLKKIIFLISLFIFVSSYSYADEKRYNVPIDNSPSYGPENAPVTIIEFLDFQ